MVTFDVFFVHIELPHGDATLSLDELVSTGRHDSCTGRTTAPRNPSQRKTGGLRCKLIEIRSVELNGHRVCLMKRVE